MPKCSATRCLIITVSLSAPRLCWSCHNPPEVSLLTSGGTPINTTSGAVYPFLHCTNKIISAALELCSLTQASAWWQVTGLMALCHAIVPMCLLNPFHRISRETTLTCTDWILPRSFDPPIFCSNAASSGIFVTLGECLTGIPLQAPSPPTPTPTRPHDSCIHLWVGAVCSSPVVRDICLPKEAPLHINFLKLLVVCLSLEEIPEASVF